MQIRREAFLGLDASRISPHHIDAIFRSRVIIDLISGQLQANAGSAEATHRPS